MKVISNTAVSLDGRINTREGGFTLLGSAQDHARMSALRAQADAVLVGGATFRNWPHPALPDPPDRAQLVGRPWNVVVSRSMQLPLDSDFLREPGIRPLFLTGSGHAVPGLDAEVECYDGIGPDLPISWILAVLRRRGVQRLLVEAGGELLFQFLAADALDEMHVTLCPLVIGGPAASLAGGAGFDLSTLRRLSLLSVEREGDELFLHYRVRRGVSE